MGEGGWKREGANVFGLWVQGLSVRLPLYVQGGPWFAFRVSGSGFWVSGATVYGLGSRVEGLGSRFQVSDFGSKGSGFWGLGFRV